MYKLTPFQASTHSQAFSLAASVFKKEGLFELSFQLKGELNDLVWPESSKKAECVDGLYQSTCFEFFLGASGQYVEWNFSPSGDWCGYAFEKYRVGRPVEKKLFQPLAFVMLRNQASTAINVKIDATELLRFLGWEKEVLLTGSLTAVLEHQIDVLSYWAMQHVDEVPNFHRKESFLIKV